MKTIYASNKETDLYHTDKTIVKQLNKILAIKDLSDEDKTKVIDFLKRSKIENLSNVQCLKYLIAINTILAFRKKSFNEFNQQDLDDFLLSMNSYKPKTRQIRWYALTKFFKFIGNDCYKEIKPRFARNNRKLPEELLTREEVNRLVINARNARDKALIAVLYESGCRIGELLSVKLKHIVIDSRGIILLLDGKTGPRRVRLVESCPLLKSWLDIYPNGETNSPLWLDNSNKKLEYNAVKVMLSRLAKRVGITKNIYPHLFRHSRATELAKYLTEQQMKVYLGWTQASEMAGIYVHLSGKDVDEAILKLNGIKIEKENEVVVRIDNKTQELDDKEEFLKFYKIWRTIKNGQ